jgi:LPXTG-motif cell wall-anchored protein
MNVNQQLGLPCGIGPFYKQPSLFYRGVDSNINMLAKTRNMQWENSCGSCGGGYSNFIAIAGAALAWKAIRGSQGGLLSYPLCTGKLKEICQKCTSEAKSKDKPGWLRDGKKNYMLCMDREVTKAEELAQQANMPTPTPDLSSPDLSSPSAGDSGNKTMLYVGIGVGVLALVGGAILLLRK